MDYGSELIIKTLRHCGSHKGCVGCPVSDFGENCMNILLAAADELEAALRQNEGQDPTEKEVLAYCRKRCLVIVGKELFHRVCVVRCKACIHYDMTNNGVNGWCNELNIPTDVGGYCSFGEMKSEVNRNASV